MQETWLEGDIFDEVISGYHIFQHNGGKGNHNFCGVAIILSPCYHEGWKAAGARPPMTTDAWLPSWLERVKHSDDSEDDVDAKDDGDVDAEDDDAGATIDLTNESEDEDERVQKIRRVVSNENNR